MSDVQIHPKMAERIVDQFRGQVLQLPPDERVKFATMLAVGLPIEDAMSLIAMIARLASGAKLRVEYTADE